MEPDWAYTISHEIWSRPPPPPRDSQQQQREGNSLFKEWFETLAVTWNIIKSRRRTYFKLKQM